MMETIKNYLDTMFAGMPNTPSVLRARDELLQMMEDKYNELIAEGKSQNEAVGTVISEFGNLSELAEALGVEQEVQEKQTEDEQNPRRIITAEEAEGFLHAKSEFALKAGIGIACFITSICWPILLDNVMNVSDGVSLLLMFAMIAVGVVLLILGNKPLSQYTFIKKEECRLSADATKLVHGEKDRMSKSIAIQKTVGILLCVLSWVPSSVISVTGAHMGDLGGILLFTCVGVGVLFIVNSAQTEEGYKILLKLNGTDTVMGNYETEYEKMEKYENPIVAAIMSVFWPTIVSIYLMASFLTFKWGITWIIWPIAVAAFSIMKACFKKSSGEEA